LTFCFFSVKRKEEVKSKFFSNTRLAVYTNFKNYELNLKLSKDYYILLAVLEVSLRNSISFYFEKNIGIDWMDSDFLNVNSKKKIKELTTRLSKTKHSIGNDRIISELSFGFWTALFRKDYATTMRIKTIKSIFPNLPNQKTKFIDRNYIDKKLNHIRIFRNRIFHHEKIINKTEFANIENDILEILEYFDTDVKEFAIRVNENV